jgi:hypothetical protein
VKRDTDMMIKISEQFSEVPAGRYLTDGEFSGERFREEYLRPSLAQADEVVVDIDGAAGYGSSFLEEAFGGLVRKGYFSGDELHRKLKIRATDSAFRNYIAAIWRFVDEARPERAAAH